jgi:hypothetical protein
MPEEVTMKRCIVPLCFLMLYEGTDANKILKGE